MANYSGRENTRGGKIFGSDSFLGRKSISGERRIVERKSFQDPGAEEFPGCQSGKIQLEGFRTRGVLKGGRALATGFLGNRRVDWVDPKPDSLLAGRLLGSKTGLDLGRQVKGYWAG